MTDKEEINMCINCNKDDCDNCLEGQSRNNKYLYNGSYYSISELARLKKLSPYKMRYRIARYGLDFAMSDYEKFKEYEREVMKNE